MTRMIDVIKKKRDNIELSKDEIKYFVEGYTNGNVRDYQVSSLLMAMFLNGMTEKEVALLTMEMVKSGDQIDLSGIEGVKVDKHSTGGVGDTTTLVLAPLVAAAGVVVPKMSGRGLGHTGGTVDKLEAMEGFHVELTQEEFVTLVNKYKLALVGQSGNLTPADKLIYALRDVTGTVDSIPLIASSIMSKKIAAGADGIVLDVKVGDGAFMKHEKDAETLAHTMVKIGKNVGRNTMAVISSMEEPLGYAIGNTLEVIEAIDTLKGKGPKDLTELSLVLGSQMVVLGKQADTLDVAREMLEAAIDDGSALEKFKELVRNQGGNDKVVDDYSLLPTAPYTIEVVTDQSGFVKQIESENMGVAASILGAGRETKDSEIDVSVGIILNKKVGDKVEKGDVLAVIHANNQQVDDVIERVKNCYTFGEDEVHPTLIKKVITE